MCKLRMGLVYKNSLDAQVLAIDGRKAQKPGRARIEEHPDFVRPTLPTCHAPTPTWSMGHRSCSGPEQFGPDREVRLQHAPLSLPCPPYRLIHWHQSPKPWRQHINTARTIDERYRDKLLISFEGEFDEEAFMFRGSMDWDQAVCLRKDFDDVRFWHGDSGSNEYFYRLMRPGKGDGVLRLLAGFIDADKILDILEERELKKSRL
ncbi:hypothetical protein FB451DRAFT_1498239 [Mycena latifolia]|nr:hypothetical protein FB451DRAFT_1498239 [Mycena latifolia]